MYKNVPSKCSDLQMITFKRSHLLQKIKIKKNNNHCLTKIGKKIGKIFSKLQVEQKSDVIFVNWKMIRYSTKRKNKDFSCSLVVVF